MNKIFSYDCYKLLAVLPSLKIEDNVWSVPHYLSFNDNLVKIKLCLKRLSMLSLNESILGYLCFSRRFRSIIVGTIDSS